MVFEILTLFLMLSYFFILDNKYIHKGTVTLLISYKIWIYWKMFPCDLRKSDSIFQILYDDLPNIDYFVIMNYFFVLDSNMGLKKLKFGSFLIKVETLMENVSLWP